MSAETPERSILEVLANPRNIDHPVLKGVAIAGPTLFMAGMSISTWLHRGIHGGVKFSDTATKFLRGANYAFTGMSQTSWVTHLTHHAFPDMYDEDSHNKWNENRPEGAPEAPMEVFRDPYSVLLEGFKKVRQRTDQLHRKSKLAILPWMLELHEYDKENGLEDRDHWPAHLREVDLDDEGDPTKLRNRKEALGLVATGASIAAVFSPITAGVWTGIHVPALMRMGGVINADAHTGEERGFRNRWRVLRGTQTPVPDENGELAANVMPGWEGAMFGEYRHKDHHENSGNPYFTDETIVRRDPPGVLIKHLEEVGHAETPGASQNRPQGKLRPMAFPRNSI